MKQTWPPCNDSTYIPSPESYYLNKELETMDPQEREELVILPKLKKVLDYAYRNSPFYRSKWDRAGLRPEDIKSLEDFECAASGSLAE